MAKMTAEALAAKVQALYGPKDAGRDIISTGSALRRPTLDTDFITCPTSHPWRTLTGLQGLPYDIITQIAGSPDAGKSTIAGEFLAYAQQQGVYVILWDTEKKFDSVRFTKHFKGDPNEINLIGTTIIRKGAGAAFKYINTILSNDPDARILIVHDSVGGSVSRARAERELDDVKNTQPASEAVENSDYMRHIIAYFDKHPGQIAWLLINQMTMKIGPMPGKSRSGGEKISFHSSLIIEMSRVQDLTKIAKGVKVKTGIISRAKIAKNHLSQTENSVHEMRVMVDAAGWHFLKSGETNGEDTETSETT